jgi:hypothetical protein
MHKGLICKDPGGNISEFQYTVCQGQVLTSALMKVMKPGDQEQNGQPQSRPGNWASNCVGLAFWGHVRRQHESQQGRLSRLFTFGSPRAGLRHGPGSRPRVF